MRALAYRVSMWLLRHSGDAGADAWRDLMQRAEKAQSDYYAADAERWRSVKALTAFREAVQRADSMISAGMPEKAQQTLMVALIESREGRRQKLPFPSTGMSEIHV